jgi:hypothetical protein
MYTFAAWSHVMQRESITQPQHHHHPNTVRAWGPMQVILQQERNLRMTLAINFVRSTKHLCTDLGKRIRMVNHAA